MQHHAVNMLLLVANKKAHAWWRVVGGNRVISYSSFLCGSQKQAKFCTIELEAKKSGALGVEKLKEKEFQRAIILLELCIDLL